MLLVTNYWVPHNTAGVFRWWNFSKYIKGLRVLTTKKQRGFRDDTLYETVGEVKRVRTGTSIAFLNGLFLSVAAFFSREDIIIFAPPSETLLVGAYLIRRFKKKTVIVDLKDQIDRERQVLKFMVPIYQWFYKRIDNVVVCAKFLDETKPCIYHGHDDLKLKHDYRFAKLMTRKRKTWAKYNEKLECGYIPDYRRKMVTGMGYGASSYLNVKHLWGSRVNMHGVLHPEFDNVKFNSWEVQAKKMENYIRSIKE